MADPVVSGHMTGVVEMTNKLRRLIRQYPQLVAGALYAEANIDMLESKRRCPVSPTPAPPGVIPGTLRASGKVDLPVIEGQRISVTLSYGGMAKDYAIVQHERADFDHTTGQAFYLSSVLNESASTMAARLAARVSFNNTQV